MGAVGGGLWHLFKGMRNSPSGARFRGGIEVCILNKCEHACTVASTWAMHCRFVATYSSSHHPLCCCRAVNTAGSSEDWRQLCRVGRPLLYL